MLSREMQTRRMTIAANGGPWDDESVCCPLCTIAMGHTRPELPCLSQWAAVGDPGDVADAG